ncbi:MAG: hypothetical protein B0W54_21485 [Cellvibrio sp. 79]|nr:MAG: hypothetical protein B0W54_21485 [Cellvibrio sp. 79]
MFNKDMLTSLKSFALLDDKRFLRLANNNAEYSYSEVIDLSARIANKLDVLKKEYDEILLIMDTSVEVVCTVIAALVMRVPIVQVPAVGDIPEKINTSLRLLPDGIRPLVAGAAQYKAKSVENIDFLDITELLSGAPINNFFQDDRQAAYRFMTQLSSGTTGHPKGITINSDQLSHNLIDIVERMNMNSSSVIVSWLPLYHDMGLMSLMLAIFSGAQINLLTPYSFVRNPINWLKEIDQYAGTHAGVPNFAIKLLSSLSDKALQAGVNLNSLQYLLVGSDMAYVDSLDAFEEKYKSIGFREGVLKPSYGLAENVVAVSLPAFDEDRTFVTINEKKLFSGDIIEIDAAGAKISCAGRPLNNTNVSIWHEGTLCEEGTIGDIFIQGGSTTRELLELDGRKNISPEDPLYTGDVGFLWQGRLYVVGRKKSLIKTMGRSFYPEVIESKLRYEYPEFESIAILQLTDFSKGKEEVVAVLESKTAQRQLLHTDSLSHEVIESVIALKKAVLINHEMQIAKMIVAKLPIAKTSSGKIARQKIASDYNLNPDRYFQVC